MMGVFAEWMCNGGWIGYYVLQDRKKFGLAEMWEIGSVGSGIDMGGYKGVM